MTTYREAQEAMKRVAKELESPEFARALNECERCGEPTRLSQTKEGSRIVHTATLKVGCELLTGPEEWAEEYAYREEDNT